MSTGNVYVIKRLTLIKFALCHGQRMHHRYQPLCLAKILSSFEQKRFVMKHMRMGEKKMKKDHGA